MQNDEASMRKRRGQRARKEGAGKERKGKERKGKERKGKERKGEVSADLGCKLCLESCLILPMLLDDTRSSDQFTLQLSILPAHHHVVVALIRQQR